MFEGEIAKTSGAHVLGGEIAKTSGAHVLGGEIPAKVHIGVQGPPGPSGDDGGFYIPKVNQIEEQKIEFCFIPSKDDMPSVEPVRIKIENSGGNVDFETDETLKLENGILSVNTTNNMEQDNTLPITSAGVFATVGNIEALLKSI